MVPLRKVSVLWDKKYSTENPDNPFYAWKISTAQFFWNTEAHLFEVFHYSETKHFRRKIVILPAPSPLIHKVFRYQNPSETQKGSSTKKNRYWDKKIVRKSRRTLLFVRKTFRSRKFSQTKEGNFPGDKKISTSFLITPFMFQQNFRTRRIGSVRKLQNHQKLLEAPKRHLSNFSALWSCETKGFQNFLVIPSYVLHKFLCWADE